MPALPRPVHIRYLRPPDREEVFRHQLVYEDHSVKVTLAADLAFEPPLTIEGCVALETGSSALWFTFPSRWHDIGLFHRADGTFTGTYTNVLTPPTFHEDDVWTTTDLFLDLWIGREGRLVVLDRDQFDGAVRAGWVDGDTATRALAEVAELRRGFARGSWPPEVVGEWGLERARRIVR